MRLWSGHHILQVSKANFKMATLAVILDESMSCISIRHNYMPKPSKLHLVSCPHLLSVQRSSNNKTFNMANRRPILNEIWPTKVHLPHPFYFNNSTDRYEVIPIHCLWVIGDTKRGQTDSWTDRRTDGRLTTNYPKSSARLQPVELIKCP